MNYVENFNFFGVEAKENPCIKGNGAPTEQTVGLVGMFYMDTDTGAVYKCTAAAEGDYVWKPLGEGEAGTYTYRGEKITLKNHTMDYALLFDLAEMRADGNGMQDGCGYGDYYFQFAPNGHFGVYDLRDNSYVGSFAIDGADTIKPHCNSACFGSTFYQPTDPFPVVYINAYNTEGLPLGTSDKIWPLCCPSFRSSFALLRENAA